MLMSAVRQFLVLALALGAAVGLPWADAGAVAGARLEGAVLDEQGRALADAAVIVRSRELAVRRETHTDTEGHFSIPNLSPGRYHLLVLREQKIVWSFPFTLPANQEVLRVDIDLKKLRAEAERLRRLDPELERQRDAERQEREQEEQLRQHHSRAVRFLQQGNPEKALQEFENIQELEPESGTSHALLAAAHAAAGHNQEAEAAYRQALALEPNEAPHHNNLGALLAGTGRLEEALNHFRRAAELDAGQAGTYEFNQGAALLNAGQAERALDPLRRAVRADPTLAVAHYFLALALVRPGPASAAGQAKVRGEAIDAFQRYLQLEPEGEFAGLASDYLEQLGAHPQQILLPEVQPSGDKQD